MSNPKRVLQVVTVMNQGGAETMVMNHYRVIDRSRVQFDFLAFRQERGFFDDEVEALGGRIFRTQPIRPWTYLESFRWLDDFFAQYAQEFVAVHSHIQENSGFVFKYAQKHRIRVCIAHSHIAFRGIDCKIPFRKFAHYFQLKYSTYNLACGADAGKYLFGDRYYELFNNAIDASKFRYDEAVRTRVRASLGIADRVVIGSVARISWQKNHTFMLDVMGEVVKHCPKALLLLVGTGNQENEVKQKIARMGLEQHVRLLGSRDDVHEILQAFDAFFMPSLFEGLPVSVIEAQAAGVPCVLSDTIDSTTDVTGRVRFVSLDASVKIWSEQLLDACSVPHSDTLPLIAKAGYDVHENVKRLQVLYGAATQEHEAGSPIITVGLPVWNAASTVGLAIRSVLCQSFRDFEFIISDDGSTDESLEVIRSFHDPRIRIIEGAENRGIAYRLNEQIRMARGKYYVRMDADDLMMPCRLEKQLEVMEKDPTIDVLGTSIAVMDEQHNFLGIRKTACDACGEAYGLLHPTIMVRMDWLVLHHYHPDYSGWEDYELWLRTRRFSRFVALSEPLLFYMDPLRFDVRRLMHRRMIGNRVVLGEWMMYDNPLTAIRFFLSNCLSCLVIPVMYLMHLDKWWIRRRNVALPEEECRQMQQMLDGLC